MERIKNKKRENQKRSRSIPQGSGMQNPEIWGKRLSDPSTDVCRVSIIDPDSRDREKYNPKQ
jgi:hypothetical protein